jgi:predicted nicotinamide N-methyase
MRKFGVTFPGAGAGISGIYALKRWPAIREYIFTDCHARVLENLRHNLAVNAVGGRVEYLDWEQEEEGERSRLLPDVVLGADIVYDARVIPSLVSTLSWLLGAGAVAYIVSTIRNGIYIEDDFLCYENFTHAVSSSI